MRKSGQMTIGKTRPRLVEMDVGDSFGKTDTNMMILSPTGNQRHKNFHERHCRPSKSALNFDESFERFY